jgi:DNA-binding response OmpR family regulator
MKPFAARKLVAKVRHALGQGVALDESADVPPTACDYTEKGYVITVGADGDLLDWLETALAHRKVACRGAHDLSRARELAKDRLPDILFIDVDVPEADRDELVAASSALAADLGAPVYLMTGLPAEYWNGVNVAGILRKPFSITEVFAAVSAALTGTL